MSVIKIVEPNSGHYEAFKDACRQMQDYINNEKIDDIVGKRESKGFIFAQEEFKNLKLEEFNLQIVDFYDGKRKDEENRPPSPRDPSRKISPEYFYFIMDDDKIIGSVNARPLPRDEFDLANGLKSYGKWDNLSPNGVRVTTSTILLPEYRGKGLAGEVKKQFFNKLRAQEIEEVVATVEIDNQRSNNAQHKLISSYGGRFYNVSGENPETKEFKSFYRYVVNTDTTGKSKNLYSENADSEKSISDKISELKHRLHKDEEKESPKLLGEAKLKELRGFAVTQPPRKATEIKINPVALGYVQQGQSGKS